MIEIKNLSVFYKALSDETRLKIILFLMENGEQCVCKFIELLDMSQPAVSHHLKILKEAGILLDSRHGKWIYYSLNFDNLQKYLILQENKLIIPFTELLKK